MANRTQGYGYQNINNYRRTTINFYGIGNIYAVGELRKIQIISSTSSYLPIRRLIVPLGHVLFITMRGWRWWISSNVGIKRAFVARY